MTFGDVVPMLGVGDIERSRTFYQDALGFEMVGSYEPDGRLCWCALRRGGAEVFLSLAEEPVGEADRQARRRMQFYFYPDDVEGLHADLRARGYDPSDLRVTFYDMKEFELEDPEAVTWAGGQVRGPRSLPIVFPTRAI